MSAAAAPKIPMGMSLMLKSLGIEIDPAVIPKVIGAVQELDQRIERIEANQKLILKALGVEIDAGN